MLLSLPLILLLLLLQQFLQLLQLRVIGIHHAAIGHHLQRHGDVVGKIAHRAAVEKIVGGRSGSGPYESVCPGRPVFPSASARPRDEHPGRRA